MNVNVPPKCVTSPFKRWGCLVYLNPSDNVVSPASSSPSVNHDVNGLALQNGAIRLQSCARVSLSMTEFIHLHCTRQNIDTDLIGAQLNCSLLLISSLPSSLTCESCCSVFQPFLDVTWSRKWKARRRSCSVGRTLLKSLLSFFSNWSWAGRFVFHVAEDSGVQCNTPNKWMELLLSCNLNVWPWSWHL